MSKHPESKPHVQPASLSRHSSLIAHHKYTHHSSLITHHEYCTALHCTALQLWRACAPPPHPVGQSFLGCGQAQAAPLCGTGPGVLLMGLSCAQHSARTSVDAGVCVCVLGCASSFVPLHVLLFVARDLACCFCRVGHQSHMYTVCIRYIWQGIHQKYGHVRCVYTILANPMLL